MKVEWLKFENRFEIDDWTTAKLRNVYPFFDKEILKMEMWYIANPKKQKKNHYRFIINWLNRVKDREGIRTSRDYKRDNEDFRKNLDEMKEKAAPPPDEWREMMQRLKRG